MKKLLPLLCLALIAFTSTSVFAISQTKAKAMADSIAMVDSIARADSLEKAKLDSIAFIEAKAKSDSILAAGPEIEKSGFLADLMGSDLYQMYVLGGIFMPYLLLASVLGFAIILWKLLIFIYMGVISYKPIGKGIFYVILLALGYLSLKLDPILLIPMMAYIIYVAIVAWNKDPRNDAKLFDESVKMVKENPQKAIEFVSKKTGPIASMLESAFRRWHRGSEVVEKSLNTAGTLEVAFLEKGLVWLSTIAVIAPLLGFLGTVSGMINAFQAIAAAAQVNAKLVATGIYEALITTAVGLIIAIPIHAFHNYFVTTIDSYVVHMEEIAEDLIDAMSE